MDRPDTDSEYVLSSKSVLYVVLELALGAGAARRGRTGQDRAGQGRAGLRIGGASLGTTVLTQGTT